MQVSYTLERQVDADGILVDQADEVIYLGTITDDEGDQFTSELMSPIGLEYFEFD